MQQWASGVTMRFLGWMIVASITAANAWLALNTTGSVQGRWIVWGVLIYAATLAYVVFVPLRPVSSASTDRGFAGQSALTAV
jgi:hypothetical protein